MYILNERTSWNQLDYTRSRINKVLLVLIMLAVISVPCQVKLLSSLQPAKATLWEKSGFERGPDRNFHSEEAAYSSKWITYALRPSGREQTDLPSLPAILELSKQDSHWACQVGGKKSWLTHTASSCLSRGFFHRWKQALAVKKKSFSSIHN